MSLLLRILFVLTLGILPPVAVQTWSAFDLRRQRERELHDDALRLSRLASTEVDRVLDGAKQLLVTLSLTRSIRDKDAETCRNLLARMRSEFPQYTVLYATDRTGDNWCNSGRLTSGVTAADSAAFDIATETEQFAIGDYAVGRFTGKPTLHLALPFYDDAGDLQGVVAAGLSLEWLQQFLRDKPWPPGFALTITDRQSTILVRFPDADLVGKPVPQKLRPIWEQAARADRAGTIETVALDGKRRVIGYQPLRVPPVGLYVSIGLDPELAVAGYDRALWGALIWAALSLVIAGSAAYLLARTFITRPIEQLLHM